MQPREKTKCICTAQPEKEMALLREVKTASVLGMQAVASQISRKERLQRKKHMGVCRRQCTPTSERMARFPATVSTDVSRKSPHVQAPGPREAQQDERAPSRQVLAAAPGHDTHQDTGPVRPARGTASQKPSGGLWRRGPLPALWLYSRCPLTPGPQTGLGQGAGSTAAAERPRALRGLGSGCLSPGGLVLDSLSPAGRGGSLVWIPSLGLSLF